MDGLKAVERDLLAAVERSGQNGLLYHSDQINQLVARYNVNDVRDALRNLIGAKRLSVANTADKGHLLTLPRAAMTDGTHVVLGVITDAGSNGIDAVSIGQRTKLPRAEVLKSLQALLQSQQIQETRNFVNRAQKIFMLATLEPSERVTGGSFFTNRVLDTDFIGRARDVIHARLKQQDTMRVSDMKAALDADQSTSQRHLSMKEVAILARTLELDDLIRRVGGALVANVGRANRPASVLFDDFSNVVYCLGSRSRVPGDAARDEWPPVEMAWAASVPCTGCPHLHDCDIVGGRGIVNPNTCKYLGAWISKAVSQQQVSAAAASGLGGTPLRREAPDGGHSGPQQRPQAPAAPLLRNAVQ